ncbi:protein of unknown function [Rhodovastum atsumiense]|nr:protein of unknown function [Rhodovastum atsumiense]
MECRPGLEGKSRGYRAPVGGPGHPAPYLAGPGGTDRLAGRGAGGVALRADHGGRRLRDRLSPPPGTARDRYRADGLHPGQPGHDQHPGRVPDPVAPRRGRADHRARQPRHLPRHGPGNRHDHAAWPGTGGRPEIPRCLHRRPAHAGLYRVSACLASPHRHRACRLDAWPVGGRPVHPLCQFGRRIPLLRHRVRAGAGEGLRHRFGAPGMAGHAEADHGPGRGGCAAGVPGAEHRQPGRTPDLPVVARRFLIRAAAGDDIGTATFGGGTDFYKAWGATDAAATRLVDICRDHGVSLFDTADSYSMGLAERILGEAIRGRRNRLLIWARCATSAVRTSPAGT